MADEYQTMGIPKSDSEINSLDLLFLNANFLLETQNASPAMQIAHQVSPEEKNPFVLYRKVSWNSIKGTEGTRRADCQQHSAEKLVYVTQSWQPIDIYCNYCNPYKQTFFLLITLITL